MPTDSLYRPRRRLGVWQFLVQTWRGFVEHDIPTRASAIAFSAMMATVPVIALVVSITVHFLPDLTGRYAEFSVSAPELENVLRIILPQEAVGIVLEQIARVQATPPLITVSLGLALTVWAASSLFVAIISGLNHIYGLPETRSIWKLRLIALLLTVVQTTVLIGSLLVIAGWPQIVKLIGVRAELQTYAAAVKWTAVTIAVLISYACWFRFGPASKQQRRWVTPGSLVGALAFIGVCTGFRVYVQNFASYDLTYGSLGGVMVLLFWYWLSSMTLLLAAEINRVIYQPDFKNSFWQKGEVPSIGEVELHLRAALTSAREYKNSGDKKRALHSFEASVTGGVLRSTQLPPDLEIDRNMVDTIFLGLQNQISRYYTALTLETAEAPLLHECDTLIVNVTHLLGVMARINRNLMPTPELVSIRLAYMQEQNR